MARDNLPRAVQDCHNLLVWLIPLLDDFPRSRRFTLGERLEAGLIEILELLVEAAYSKTREPVLVRRYAEDRCVMVHPDDYLLLANLRHWAKKFGHAPCDEDLRDLSQLKGYHDLGKGDDR